MTKVILLYLIFAESLSKGEINSILDVSKNNQSNGLDEEFVAHNSSPVIPLSTKQTLLLVADKKKETSQLSVYTLTALLGAIYALAFVLAIIWFIWLYVRKKEPASFRRTRMTNPRNFYWLSSSERFGSS